MFPVCAFCQDSTPARIDQPLPIEKVNPTILQALIVKYNNYTTEINKKTYRLLQQLEKKELRLQSKISRRDSLKTKEVFNNATSRYELLKNRFKNSPADSNHFTLKSYLPGMDSMQTYLKFLQQSNTTEQLKKATRSLQQLQGCIQRASEVQDFANERQAQLQKQLASFNVSKQLGSLNKATYYYGQQIAQYKTALHDPQKIESLLLSAARKFPLFQRYMQQNSYFAQLFPASAGNPNAPTIAAFNGLQTREQVNSFFQQRLGGVINSAIAEPAATTGPFQNPQQYIQQQVQQDQQQLSNLQNNFPELQTDSTGLKIPSFHQNIQKTKKLWQRLEYGINIQSQKNTSYLPVTTDIALTAGYKPSDNCIIGLGAGYRIGWGQLFKHISITNEGIGVRSFVDIKAKGSLWLSCGFEKNYLQSFTGLRDLHKNVQLWQNSFLAGITKKYKVGKKEGNAQLLYDFLANRQIPAAQPLKFRIGYIFK